MASIILRGIAICFVLIGIIGLFLPVETYIIHFDLRHDMVRIILGSIAVLVSFHARLTLLFLRLIGVLFLIYSMIGFAIPERLDVKAYQNMIHLVEGALFLYLGTYGRLRTKPMKRMLLNHGELYDSK